MSQILFLIILVLVVYFGYKSYSKVIKAIRLGKAETIPKTERKSRLKNVFLIAFGQKKMFKRPIPALMHLFIYVAFLFTQIELIEIIVDGLSGKHRLFANPLGDAYTILINWVEILSLFALIGTVIFLIRRLILKLPRFHKAEMKGWPTKDALYILFAEIVLVGSIFMMNGADGILQLVDSQHYPDTGMLWLSENLSAPMLQSFDSTILIALERIGWWLHILVVFGFILYLPYSKHLHIFFAFPNTYFARINSRGQMENMPEVEKEVKSMLGLIEEPGGGSMDDIPDFGAKDVHDLNRRDLLGAFSCTECGRCTSVCPANLTGKKLSPRKIMMDVRDRAMEVIDHQTIENNTEPTGMEDKNLFSYISKEEIHACTSCNACVEACPILINPLDIILQLRRYEILTEGAGPEEWIPMFTSLENSGSVWQIAQDRDAWKKELT